MAGAANVNRQAVSRLLWWHFEGLSRAVGLMLQATRAYESVGRGSTGLTQGAIETSSGISQSQLSELENGSIPGTWSDATLQNILNCYGFQPGSQATKALKALLIAMRDCRPDDLACLEDEPPD